MGERCFEKRLGANHGLSLDAMRRVCFWFCIATSASGLSMPGKYLGVDLGTSGARISVVSGETSKETYNANLQWDKYDDHARWVFAVKDLIKEAPVDKSDIQSICISGTSASCVILNGASVTRTPRMYDFAVSNDAVFATLDRFAPPKHTTRSATSCLAKLLSWHDDSPLQPFDRLCHQADYVTMQFLQNKSTTCSDWHNCLKLGYDVQKLEWPTWLLDCLDDVKLHRNVLPKKVVSPGQVLGSIDAAVAKDLGLPQSCVMVGGTTDSNAAFIAATASKTDLAPGVAVTSLGSTLAIKQLSEKYIEDAERGIYSHRFPSTLAESGWLVGGASNVGCAVLRSEQFSNDELAELSNQVDPGTDSELVYYPLVGKGERFPISDSEKLPLLEPKPVSRSEYLHGILQAISTVERDGFLALCELGAPPPTPIFTCGGGSKNEMWSRMRQRRLREVFSNQVIVDRAENVEASYGAAILAASTFV